MNIFPFSIVSQCCGVRKPQPKPPNTENPTSNEPSETEPLLAGNNAEHRHYQKWLERQYETWKTSRTSKDFDTWLESQHPETYRDDEAIQQERMRNLHRQRMRTLHATRLAAARRGVII